MEVAGGTGERGHGIPVAPRPNEGMALLARHEVKLYRYLVALSNDCGVARDALFHAFARAVDRLYEGSSVEELWLYRTARANALDALGRQAGAVRGSPLRDTAGGEAPGWLRARTNQVLAALSPEDRESLYLYHCKEYTFQQVQGIVGVRAGAMRSRVLGAKERFEARMRELEGAG